VSAGCREEILRVLASAGSEVARRRGEWSSVWHIGNPGCLSGLLKPDGQRTVDALRERLLRVILDSPEEAFITHPDDPTDEDVPGDWEACGGHTWRLPKSLDLGEPHTAYWLFALGNWTIVVGSRGMEGGQPDPFRCDDLELLAWMMDRGAEVLVATWPDAVDWIVAVAPEGGVGGRVEPGRRSGR
jgi:hypothetical protein